MKYIHDCDKCVYITHIDGHDCYICNNSTIVMRNSSIGSDYHSFSIDLLKLTVKGKMQALASYIWAKHNDNLYKESGEDVTRYCDYLNSDDYFKMTFKEFIK